MHCLRDPPPSIQNTGEGECGGDMTGEGSAAET